MTQSKRRPWSVLFAVALLSAAALAPAAAAPQTCGPDPNGRVADVSYHDTTIYWDPVVEYEALVLTIGGPCEDIVRIFGRGEQVSFDIREIKRITDGNYTWELRRIPTIDPSTQQALQLARKTGNDSIWWELWQAGRIPEGPYVDSASFTVDRGVIIPPDQVEERRGPLAENDGSSAALAPAAMTGGAVPALAANGAEGPSLAPRGTVLTNADGIIRNSLCVGFDCPNSPTFSDSTILLMENNTRIKFDDTSTISGFPNNDWELQANSSSSGGGNFFAINDCANSSQGGCADDPVFKVEAGARSNALYVESDGDIGVGTANPVVRMHLVDGDTPALRLEQNSSSGFAPQTWDVAGNETSFFVRDATNGSTLPFRIEPGVSSNMLYLDSNDRVGIGTSSPQDRLHVTGTDNPKVLIQDTNDNANDKPGFILRSPAAASGGDWTVETDNAGNFQIDFGPSTGPEIVIADQTATNGAVTINGNLTVNGTFSNPSSRTLKQDFTPVDPEAVLQQLATLPITEWTYKADLDQRRHIGPIAEDFQQAFGLGTDGKYLFPIDVQGVTMAALKGLQLENDALKAENAEIKARLARLEALLLASPKAEE